MILLSQKAHDVIKSAGAASYPNECCGFLLGSESGGAKEVKAVVPVENRSVESEKYHRFFISPEDFLVQERTARKEGREILGFYHSHPNAEARPSRFDTDHAWPWYSYVIVGVRNQRAGEMTSWVLRDDRESFIQEDVRIVS